MTLFKSLANTPLGDDNNTSSSSTNKTPAFPPTAVQLYSSKYIHFISDTVQKFYDHDNDNNNHAGTDTTNDGGDDNGNKNDDDNGTMNDGDESGIGTRNRISKKDLKTLPKRYEILSYQPVHVPDNGGSSSSAATATAAAAAAVAPNANTHPNLGVWDCRLTSSASNRSSTSTGGGSSSSSSKSTSYLLKSALYHQNQADANADTDINHNHTAQKPTFVLTIDLESIEDVHATLSTMMESVVQSMDIGMESGAGAGASTGVEQKEEEEKQQQQQQQQQFQDPLPKFGIAPSSRENETMKIKEDLFDNANVIICAILPYSITCSSSNKNEGGGEHNKTKTMMTYKEKQGFNLILYHLLKYANTLNCTLCFLNQNDTYEDGGGGYNDNGSSGNDIANNADGDMEAKDNNGGGSSGGGNDGNGLIPHGMSVKEFKHVLRAICFGINNTNSIGYHDQIVSSILQKSSAQLGGVDGVTNDNGSMNNEGLGTIDEEKEQDPSNEKDEGAKNDENLLQVQTSIYLPGGYDVDLIDSVYLRSASCAGVWDANTDSLWVALPSSTSTPSDSNSALLQKKGSGKGTTSGSGGDEEWLSKLADSVSAYTNSTFGVVGSSDATKSSATMMMEEGSMKSGKTKIKDGSSVVTTSTKSKRVGRKKPSGASSKKAGDKDDVSDFFTDLLKN